MSILSFVAVPAYAAVVVQHGFSAAFHFVFLLAFAFFWLRPASEHAGSAKQRVERRMSLFQRLLISACAVVGMFYLCLSVLTFVCYQGGRRWQRDQAVALSDATLRAATWLTTAVYLAVGLRSHRFPVFLRIWWGLLFLMSCSSLAVDLFYLRKRDALSIPAWVFDIVSALSAFIVSSAAFFGNSREERAVSDTEEPLLNGVSANAESCAGNTSLFANAGFLSTLTFYWIGPLLAVGNRKTLDFADVPHLEPRDCIDGIFPIFRTKLDSCTVTSSASSVTTFQLAKALLLTTWQQAAVTAVYAIVYTLATYVGPYLIDFLVRYLNGEPLFAGAAYWLVLTFVVGKLLECLSQRHCFFQLQQAGIRIRAALVAIIYQKGLTLSSRSKQSQTSGEVINLMSVDADRIGLFSWYMHDLWLVPLQVALALLILYINLGLAAGAALLATVLVMLANVPLGKMQEKYQGKVMECKDTRMKATSEILRNMRILKLQGWEMKFLAKVIKLRKNEESSLRKLVYTSALTSFVFWGAPIFVAVATFGFCMLVGIPLSSGKVLSALATFRVLQEPIYNLPDMVSMIIQTKVSLDRIASFLCLEELQSDTIERLPSGFSEIVAEVVNGTFSWDHSPEAPTLKDLNFKVLQGMRVAVCGTVGSGKSSLLSSLLGEVPKVSGSVWLCGTTAYVPQSPWIQSGKIQDNILFGKEMDREKYEKVLKACCLKKDLEILAFGDQTMIGERGINLSGGQKQRIQIARALYHDADIFLFDDPFSAVDAHTGTHLFKECLLGHLASKTVIYVTHQVEFLPSADLVLCMKDGRIVQAGKYNDVLNSGTEFRELVGAHRDALAALGSIELGIGAPNNIALVDDSDTNIGAGAPSQGVSSDEQNGKADETYSQTGQLVQEEEREKGRVGCWVYWKYVTMAYGGALVPLILLGQILFQILQIGSNYWMAWAAPVSEDEQPPVNGSVLIYVYVALAVGSSFCVLVRAMLLVTAGYKTATLLFNKLHNCIFRAPMSFFDSTPSGRILNRASTDQNAVDTTIPYQIGTVAFAFIQLVGIIVVMSQVAWQVFIVFIPVLATCIWYQLKQMFQEFDNTVDIGTARELSRLNGVCKAPIIQHFSESLSGSTTIRSFDQNKIFIKTNFNLSDQFSQLKFHTAATMEWLCFRLDMLSSLMFAFSLVFLISMPKGVIDPGISGLAVAYGLNLNMLLTWLMWSLCQLENSMISVERILQYTTIDSEPPLLIESNKLDSSWPSNGEIELHNLQVRYRANMPLVLRGLTCTFPGGMKTGIVGRTGSGKSTLIQALFRIIDPAVGQIAIDGIDISTIGLHDLRSRLSIIPQDPTMFEGTVRSNLDPLEEYKDEEIWKAVDSCQLGDEVRKKELKLDSEVTENGENWSVGQRQLVCLGRVILKKSKVLVLDEATASVDTATDSVIQKTLKQQFSESTVITIAHRITSVLDNAIPSLGPGVIVEHDKPARLLENKSSLFAKLVAEYTMRSSASFGDHNN
ncbi:hypothetical protein ZIOFF_050591 [Zingiber officinale]|uniref:ABC transporter C family member 3 n=1 Tax=Zingiber officinale TaxID=94328 RepID=A0A8J5FJ40_ZINOF|nr:hypothetical protein ZIOFF_050591 [Zingiber officinale]